MGKGYNNYMTKKPFHPGSKANIKRTWMAEQRTENEKRKQEELKTQYDKEQDLYNNRALLSTESKDKLQLNFMYEAPPGAKRERQKEDDEPEYKFEWQRKYNAPREDYAKGNSEIRDQPFGIPVRNVRCIKCHKWGHINTDKECPLYTHASTSSMPTTSMDPLELMRQMREDGYDLKRSALGHQVNPKQANEQFIPSDNSDPEIDFLKSLSAKQKRKLLKKLNKLSKKQKADQKKKKGKKKSKKRTADSDSESEEESKKKKKQKKAKVESSNLESELDSSDGDEKPILKEKKAKVSSKVMKKSTLSLPSKHKEQQIKKQHRTAEDSDSEKKSNRIISPKSTTTDKFKRTANDTKTGKPKEEKKSSHVEDSDMSKKDNSKKQNTSLSEDTTPKQSFAENTRVKTKSNSCGSSSDTSDEKKQFKKIKSPKIESSSDAQLFVKPDENQPSTSGVAKTTGDVKAPSKDQSKVVTHPDGFDPAYPQRTTPDGKNNPTKQDQALYDKYRDLHRHRRSPSVKHKYRSS